MNVLIIGGSGFLSGSLARAALAEGHSVWTVTRGGKQLPVGVHTLIADRNDPHAFANVIADAGVRWDLAIDCIAFNAEHARQDLAALHRHVDHLVAISSDFVISAVNRPWQIDQAYDRFDDSPYGRGKRQMETTLLESKPVKTAGAFAVTILRPGHLYGPGSLLGCLPAHGRDPQLLQRMRRGEPLKLIGGGFFLQAPIYAQDLWATIKSCVGNPLTHGQIYFTPGPEVIESRQFYNIIGQILGVPAVIEEIGITEYLAANPMHQSFCCHRVYCTDKASSDGVTLATTPLLEGLRKHVYSML